MKAILKGLKSIELRTSPTYTLREEYSLLEVARCAVCRTDAKMWEQGHRDLQFPRVPGHEIVVSDGRHRYVVWPGNKCGTCVYCTTHRENLCEDIEITGFHVDGGFADKIVVASDNLVPIPDSLNSDLATFAEPAGCIIHAFGKLDLPTGARVLVFGGGTVGLLAALYAQHRGYVPVILEKSIEKIKKGSAFLDSAGVRCEQDTIDSDFDAVINACPDHIAFCKSVTKVAKGGTLSFFSGLNKNEYIETNLLNLLHYKEIGVRGTYGLTRKDMHKAVGFIEKHTVQISHLIEDVTALSALPGLMEKVLSGRYLKFIIDPTLRTADVSFATIPRENSGNRRNATGERSNIPEATDSLLKTVIKSIVPVDATMRLSAINKIDDKAKPVGSLGRLEELAVQMCTIQNTLTPSVKDKMLFVFAGDHGVAEEGVSAFPSEVTGQMVQNFLKGGAAINVLCRHHHIDLRVIDIGVNADLNSHPDLLDMKVAKGTKNFTIQPAMTPVEMRTALENGITAVLDTYRRKPFACIGLGEMGIGNSTSAAAIIAAVTGMNADDAAGRGTGVDDKGLAHKAKVIQKALSYHQPDSTSGYDILCKIGGFEIAGIAGAILAAASLRVATVLDGLISTAGGLIAYLINPDIKGYLIAGHRSVEPAQSTALASLGLEPYLDFQMRLGEGTGAALVLDTTEAACRIMVEMASFNEAKVSRKKNNIVH